MPAKNTANQPSKSRTDECKSAVVPRRCKYSSTYCGNVCAQNRRGKYLTLCQEHRSENNRRQRKYDERKRLEGSKKRKQLEKREQSKQWEEQELIEPFKTPQGLLQIDIETLWDIKFNIAEPSKHNISLWQMEWE